MTGTLVSRATAASRQAALEAKRAWYAKERAAADRRAAEAAVIGSQAGRCGLTAAQMIEARVVLYGLLTAEDVVELQRRRAKCER